MQKMTIMLIGKADGVVAEVKEATAMAQEAKKEAAGAKEIAKGTDDSLEKFQKQSTDYQDKNDMGKFDMETKFAGIENVSQQSGTTVPSRCGERNRKGTWRNGQGQSRSASFPRIQQVKQSSK